ncbi:MAG: hypothetical protein PHX83_12050 [Acidobacteriia bacterium]|nr:hypothetical protein [Terriglobia bacterium]
MAKTDQLGAPAANSHQMGRFTLNRFVRQEATVAAPVVWTNMSYITQIEIGEPSWDYEADIFQQGGGDDKTHIRRGPRWDGTLTILGGKAWTDLATFYGQTWSTAGTGVLSLRQENDLPVGHWEAICRDSDNVTVLFSLVIQDMVIDDIGFTNQMDYGDRTIKFHTYHEPFVLCSGAEMVFDKFNATPTTAVYQMSSGTPVTLVTATSHDDWDYDTAVFVKLKDKSDSWTTKRVKSGITIGASGTITFTTGTPAASDVVSCLWAKVSA